MTTPLGSPKELPGGEGLWVTSNVWTRLTLDMKSIVFEVVFFHWGDGASPEMRHPKEPGKERLAGSWRKGPSGPQRKVSGHVAGSQLVLAQWLGKGRPLAAARCTQRPPSSLCLWPGLGHRPRSGSGGPPGRHRVSTAAGRGGHGETAASSSTCCQVRTCDGHGTGEQEGHRTMPGCPREAGASRPRAREGAWHFWGGQEPPWEVQLVV